MELTVTCTAYTCCCVYSAGLLWWTDRLYETYRVPFQK